MSKSTQVTSIIALNNYGRGGHYITAGWASEFPKTFKTAHRICKEQGLIGDSTTFFSVSWYESSPSMLSVMESSIMDKTRFTKELPLEGALADALIADLQPFAERKAAEDLKREEEEQLRAAARARVTNVVNAALLSTLTEP